MLAPERGPDQLNSSHLPNLATPLSIVITSGGTRVPIDAVRHIGNDSGGTTGALLAESALARGHVVHYLCSKNAVAPFSKKLIMQPEMGISEELRRLQIEGERYLDLAPNLEIEKIADFESYRQRLLEIIANPKVDVAILSMAASDFGPKPVDGKLSSDSEHLTLDLVPLPKIISEVRHARGNLFLVGFKLLVDTPPDLLIEAAYRNMLRDSQDLCVANVGGDISRPDKMLTYLLTPERGIISISRDKLQEALMEQIESRHSRKFFSTKHSLVPALPLEASEVRNFIDDIRRISTLALFNPYLDREDRREFGFVAKRTTSGTLITARGSSKSSAEIDDLALVTAVSLEQRVLDVTSTKRKASLNANLVHLIFANRPEVNYIVHAHIELPEAAIALRSSAPGTLEDWQSIESLVKEGASIIQQPNHGVLILLDDLSSLPAVLESNSIYHRRPDLYDLAYNRFIGKSRLIELLADRVPISARVLDLAAGTGEVSRHLLDRGYKDIHLVDASSAMLAQARKKLGALIGQDHYHVARMEELDGPGMFDAIVIRQAVNYIAHNMLGATMRRLSERIKSGGYLLFNTFDSRTLQSGHVHSTRARHCGHILVAQEGNLREGNRLLHGQRTEIFDEVTGAYELVYDLNTFSIFQAEELTSAMRTGGFDNIEILREGRSLYFIGQKK